MTPDMLMTLASVGRLRARLMKALAPHWGALLALALSLVVGLAVLDDYGIVFDEVHLRLITTYNLEFIRGNADALPHWFAVERVDRLYGSAFELPILLTEYALGLETFRGIHLFRHLQTHLFFLAGGLFAYLLAVRLFRNRLFAVIAMLLFLLHPRLYAHSFFNSKDIPFLVAFMIALYLAHRTFKKDTLWAFALLGAAGGALVNLRIMGVVLFAAVLAARTLDFAFASGWAERKRVVLAAVVFALTGALVVFALFPYLWADPGGRFAEWWSTFSDHPTNPMELFRGTVYRSSDFPVDYLPAWIAITSPPFALLLGLIGAALILLRALKAPREALQNTRPRFGLLLAACFALPILAVIMLDSNIYNAWRQMYFLWAPFSLLAAWGLRGLAATLPARRLRATVYGAAVAALAATLASMAMLHPNQQAFFNFSVDRVTPERLWSQYEIDYWRHPMLQSLLWLSNNADLLPDKTAEAVRHAKEITLENAAFLPDAARARIAGNMSFDLLPIARWASWARSARALHRVRVYDSTIFTIEGKDDLRAVYEATRGRKPDIAAAYDVHQLDGAVALVMEPCAPAFIQSVSATLRATPVNRGDLPPWREGNREEPRVFPLVDYGAFFDGKCVASLPLPDYPISEFRLVWRPELQPREAAREAQSRAQANGRLLARSAYDVYLANGELVYVQEQCDPIETEHPFRVSVFYEQTYGLPGERREWGREIHEFDFRELGALLEEGACVALFPLPDYPVDGIRTGQFVEGGDDVWQTAFSANPEPYAAAYRAVAGSEPLARGAFDLHLLDGDLVYVKEPCDQADTGAKFFLHIIPERVGELPEERREFGFDNLDFRFFLNGAWFDGECAARVALPDYPIASVRTGQFVVGAGEIWSAEFEVGG